MHQTYECVTAAYCLPFSKMKIDKKNCSIGFGIIPSSDSSSFQSSNVIVFQLNAENWQWQATKWSASNIVLNSSLSPASTRTPAQHCVAFNCVRCDVTMAITCANAIHAEIELFLFSTIFRLDKQTRSAFCDLPRIGKKRTEIDWPLCRHGRVLVRFCDTCTVQSGATLFTRTRIELAI